MRYKIYVGSLLVSGIPLICYFCKFGGHFEISSDHIEWNTFGNVFFGTAVLWASITGIFLLNLYHSYVKKRELSDRKAELLNELQNSLIEIKSNWEDGIKSVGDGLDNTRIKMIKVFKEDTKELVKATFPEKHFIHVVLDQIIKEAEEYGIYAEYQRIVRNERGVGLGGYCEEKGISIEDYNLMGTKGATVAAGLRIAILTVRNRKCNLAIQNT